jgi:ubiquinone/menaquinone biosynthesis C-methylase UbiE
LRKLFKKYDWDKYFVTEQLVKPGEKILDIGCGNGYMLQKVKGKFQELYGIDISPSRLQEAKKRLKSFILQICRDLNLLKEKQIILFLFQIIILILLFV